MFINSYLKKKIRININFKFFHTAPDAVQEFQSVRESWLKTVFEKATIDETGYIDQDTCVQLIKTLDSNVATVRVRQKLQVFQIYFLDRNRLTIYQ